MKRILLLTMVFFSIFSHAQFPEGFEGATFPPTGWVVEDNGVGTAQSWGRTNAAGFGWVHQGTWSAMVNRDGGPTSAGLAQDWLITPQVTVPTNGQIRFYSRSGSNGEQGSVYKVLMSTTTQNRAAFTTTLATYTELDIENLPFKQMVILLNAYAGQNVYFAFVMEVNNGLGDRWILDDVKVDQQCLTPTALNVTPSTNSAVLSWTSPNPAGPWEIEYGPQGFAPGTGTIISVSTNNYTLTGLLPLTAYSFYVRTICEADNVSPWSIVRNFSTTVAPPICGGNFVDPGGATGTYGNNFNNSATPVVICPTNPGEIVTVTFSSFNTEANWDALYVYDGPTTASPLISSGNPAGNVPGGLAGGYWGTTIPGPFTSSHPSGCLTFVFITDGSGTRDGWISNISCSTCPPPARVNLVSATASSLDVSWVNLAPSATSFEVIWLPAGSPPPNAASTGQIVTGNSYTITGLNSDTAYDVYVRPICGATTGNWSVKGTYRTQPDYCGGDHFYDLGGATGNYPNNVTAANGTTTICPENPGDVVTVYFNSFALSSGLGDSLTIYDGNSATGTPVGTYFGTNIIPSYTATSPTGCLTFVFVSNGSQNDAGWDATILCGPPCPSITSVLSSSSPAAGAENVIRVCQGQSVSFTGSGVFAGSGAGASYTWNFGDNTTANGQTVSHAFTNPGIYLVNLFITDANGCRNSNRINQLVYVSTNPTFTSTVSDNEICLGQSANITASATPNTFTKVCNPPVSGTTFLPDGNGVSYQTSVPVDCFPFGTTLTSASQITSVCINMEHSYLGDLSISLVSPSGQTIVLQAQGGGSANLGIPIASGTVDGAGVPGPGTGYTYCFTMSAATTLTGGIVNGVTFPSSGGGTYTDSSVPAGNYLPNQSFANLIGSSLNGNWSIIVTDFLGLDNGYIFNWGINFDSSLLPTDYQFTPVIAGSNWTPNPDITNISGNQITVTPTTVGNHCYTYNVTDDFGCTYSSQVCLNVVPGVEFTDITASPTQICNGGDGVYTFSGTPNAIVTYNINGGANQTITLDATGTAVLTLTGLNLTTDINVTYMTAPPVPTAGNAITTVGGVNPNNSTGAILAAGTTASTANSTTINASNGTVTLTLAHVVPAGTPITVSLAKNNTTGAVNIVDGPSTLLFNTGALNVLQHVTFIKGTTSNTITINRANGTVFLDGVSYSYNELGCDRPLNDSASIVVYATPIVNVTPATCTANGSAIITNYNPTFTYVFNPLGPSIDASGAILNATFGTSYTVALDNVACLTSPSPFVIDAILQNLPTPIVDTTPPTCLADGFSTITNYDGTATYTFTPAGPSVDATGLITGMILGNSYTVIASNTTCDSDPSTPFSNLIMLVTPVVPTVSITAPTCTADGFATITNYNAALTYVFTPAGPTVDASGVISGMAFNTNYEVAASNGSCTSVNSAIFTIDPILVTPAVPVISMTAPTCLADGFSTITNYDATLTYVFNPAGPTVDATGLISGMTLNTLYEVTASNATCTSVASAQFNNLIMLVTPVVPTVSITAPTCTADGFATITNYNAALTYVFTPAGPTVGTGGVISNALLNTNYEVAASNGSCTSANSSQFSVLPILPKPILVNIVSNNAICEGTSGTITITATPNSVVTYNIDGGANQTVNINNTGIVTIATPILLSNSTYNVVYVQSTIAPFCGQNQSGSATVIVNPIPDVIIIPTQTTICSGTSTSINLSSSVSGTTFTWVVVQQSNVTGASNGSGDVISQVLTSTLTGNGFVDYLVTPTSNGCVGPAQSIRINVTPRPNVTAINNNPTFCSGGITDIQLSSNNVPGAVFSWTVTGGNVLGAAGGTGTSINQILTVSPGTTSTVEVVYTIIAEANGCSGPPVIVRVYVNPIPDLNLASSTVPLCSGDSTNISFTGTVPGTVFNWVVLNSTGVSGASNGTGTSIQQVLTATSLSQGSVTYQITPTFNGCTGVSQTVTVIVNPRPELFANPIHPPICSGVLSTNIFLSTFNASTVFNWTVNSVGVNGATAGSAPGPTYTIIQNLTTSVDNVAGYVDYIITPTFAGCSGTPITVRVVVNPLPKPVLTDGSICVDEFGVPFQSYTLDSGLDNANYDFVWYFNGVAIPNSNNSTYTANAVGTYGVIATNSSTNCVSSTVANMVTATVGSTVPASGLTVTQTGYFSGNATLVVNVTGGSGTLMYSLDEGTLQTSNVFTNVSAGPHKITVIDTQGCTYFTYDVFVIRYPQYFTPNGDGINDTWYIDGLQNTDVIYIFDRYGKLIKQLRGIEGWDGTYNQENLPSTDYWFTVDYLENGVKKQFKAHFALKR